MWFRDPYTENTVTMAATCADGYDSTPELRKFPFGVLAALPETVGEDLVPKILATSGNGKKVEFLDNKRVLTKFYEKFVEGKPSEFVDDDGNVIKKPGETYADNGVAKQY